MWFLLLPTSPSTFQQYPPTSLCSPSPHLAGPPAHCHCHILERNSRDARDSIRQAVSGRTAGGGARQGWGGLWLTWLLRFQTPSQTCRRDRGRLRPDQPFPRPDQPFPRKEPSVSPTEATTELTWRELQPIPWHVSWEEVWA